MAFKNAALRDRGQRICATEGWTIRQTPATVFDCFPMNSELDMLEVRLNELEDVVDYFVIVESRVSHRNTSKPLYYQAAARRFAKFAHKILYVVLDSLEGGTNWDREHYQRNSLFTHGLHIKGREAQPGDVIIVSDLDEIVKPAWVSALKQCQGYAPQLTMQSHWSLYSFEFEVQNVMWQKIKVALFEQNQDHYAAETLRFRLDLPVMPDSAWHCSWCFASLSAFEDKLHSFAHEEVDQPSITREHIASAVREGKDLFNRDDILISKADKPDVPQFVLDNPSRYAYMISRTNLKAGMHDYP